MRPYAKSNLPGEYIIVGDAHAITVWRARRCAGGWEALNYGPFVRDITRPVHERREARTLAALAALVRTRHGR